MAWFKTKPAGTDSLKVSDDSIRANWTEVELRRLYNLVANAAFGWRSGGTSAVPDGWSLEGTPTVAYDTVDVGYGNYAVKLTASGATDEGIKQTLTNLKVSTKYQVFVRMKVTDGDTASLITTGATTNINEDSTSATWESITGEFITDASATDVVLKLVASADGDVAYFCGITVVEGDIPPANFIRRIDEDNIGATAISAAQWGYLGDLSAAPMNLIQKTDTDVLLNLSDQGDVDWTDLDCNTAGSGLVPVEANAVFLYIEFEDSAPANLVYCGFRKKGETDSDQQLTLRCAVAGIWLSGSYLVGLDANGFFQYKISASGGDTANLVVRLLGWVEPA